jgi:3,4-dihydroxy 2-butanone 4-phosphate synthase/GTP cyclohydrolase II
MTERPPYLPPADDTYREQSGRPFVTLSYAQSLDGCLTLHRGSASPVSGEAARRITHQLRSAHNAILVGIGTVLADDPRLTVRLADGDDPQPVIVDSHLRTPVSARLVERGAWIATTFAAERDRRLELERAGARVVTLPADETGRVSLGALLFWLGGESISHLMVEGGSEVITSFLRERLANRLVITFSPVLAGGYRAVGDLGAVDWQELPRLRSPFVEPAGGDLIVWGELG